MNSPTRFAIGLLSVFVAAQAAHAQSQGPNNPSTVTNDASFGTVAWAVPSNAAVSDNAYAGVTPLGTPSQYLKATGFGFSIPAGAVIDGIVASIERRSAAGMIQDSRVRIVKGGVIGAADRASGVLWPTVDTVMNYGSNADLWGEMWTAGDINTSSFGFVLSATDSVDAGFVDAMSLTVFYSVCGDNMVGLSEDCDDGNTVNGDCCSSTCEFESSGSPCPDADLCNGDETCDGAGTCTPGMPLDCDDGNVCTQDSCSPTSGCINATAPQMSCRTAQKGVLLIKDNTDNNKDKLVWKWVKGAATTVADFGIPTGTTSYTLCVYAGTTALADATIPPSATLWKPFSKGFKYKDPNKTFDGIQKVLLKSGALDKSKILVKGKGNLLLPGLPAMPFTSPVTVQLTGNNICYESVFNSPFKKNAAGKFKAKAP
jgi:cysteine-rich repeat protein